MDCRFLPDHRNTLVRLAQGCILILTLVAAAAPAFAQKTDLVYLTNGDRITGDVKSLARGRLLERPIRSGTFMSSGPPLIES